MKKRSQVTYVIDGKEKTVSGLSFLYQNKDRIYEKSMAAKEIGFIFSEKVEYIRFENMTFDESVRFTCDNLLTSLKLENCKFNDMTIEFINGNIHLITPVFSCVSAKLNAGVESFEIEHANDDNAYIDGNIHAKNVLVTNTQGIETYNLSGENIALEDGTMPKSIQIRADKAYLTRMSGETKALVSAKKLMVKDSEFGIYNSDGNCKEVKLENSKVKISPMVRFNGVEVKEGNQSVQVTDQNIEKVSARIRMISILKGIRNQAATFGDEQQREVLDFYLKQARERKKEITRQYEAMMQYINADIETVTKETEGAFQAKKVKELLPQKKN